ncbi:MAG: thiamine pyrophosphokinase [Candidatus Carbobacillus altaicus]|uniref:Thiamine diphosphokinase n=1 Tax=Candidatus Carbonibacillus altaicus TaxID=2163959 RepID=A0A2R6Y0S9_9BACL|nr:MAG: thiamine pyrophosphokinase [Candidatus Carbobacillus altaicus]
MLVFIVSGGEKEAGSFAELLAEYSDENDKPYVIGVDAGALWLVRHQFPCDLAVGDFDTIGEAGVALLEAQGIPLLRAEAEKAETDTEMALDWALLNGARSIVIEGGIGSRFDHSLSNVSLIYRCLRHGVPCVLQNPWNRVRLIGPGKTRLKTRWPYVSLIPFSEVVRGITLDGFYYPLREEDLSWGYGRGVSNEPLRSDVSITVQSGYLLVIESRDPKSRDPEHGDPVHQDP